MDSWCLQRMLISQHGLTVLTDLLSSIRTPKLQRGKGRSADGLRLDGMLLLFADPRTRARGSVGSLPLPGQLHPPH